MNLDDVLNLIEDRSALKLSDQIKIIDEDDGRRRSRWRERAVLRDRVRTCATSYEMIKLEISNISCMPRVRRIRARCWGFGEHHQK